MQVRPTGGTALQEACSAALQVQLQEALQEGHALKAEITALQQSSQLLVTKVHLANEDTMKAAAQLEQAQTEKRRLTEKLLKANNATLEVQPNATVALQPWRCSPAHGAGRMPLSHCTDMPGSTMALSPQLFLCWQAQAAMFQ